MLTKKIEIRLNFRIRMTSTSEIKDSSGKLSHVPTEA